MTVTDQQIHTFDAQDSFSMTGYPRFLALTLSLLAASAAIEPNALTAPASYVLLNPPEVHQTLSVYSTVFAGSEADDIRLFYAINNVHDQLLRSRQTLDSESENLLYENLWDLYG
jgi:hypothetical protein